MKNIASVTYRNAVNAAVSYAQLDRNDIFDVTVRPVDGLYEICLHTSFQKYDFFVDAENYEVLGISSEPSLIFEEPCTDAYAFNLSA